MEQQRLNGEEALARAAARQGLTLATGYPGSPAGGIIRILSGLGTTTEVHWSTNEKVAVEKALGVAINGKKALVCVKGVGLNAMLDPLTVANLTPLTGALVIVVGDDPGGYGSQNDQDSRLLGRFLNLPWLEPADPQAGYHLMQLAFGLSHAYGLPVFLRITRSYARQHALVNEGLAVPRIKPYPLLKLVAPRFVPCPANAVAKNQELKERMQALAGQLSTLDVNRQSWAEGTTGLVVCGHLISKLKQVIALQQLAQEAPLLLMQSIHPLPVDQIAGFLTGLGKVIVLEENTAVIGHELMAIAAKHRLQLNWQLAARPGEIFRWQLAAILSKAFPGLTINPAIAGPVEEKPVMKNNCLDCRYDEVLDLFDACAADRGATCHYYGDPGCLVIVSDRLYGKFALGGSVATAFGAAKASPEIINIAFIGDSGFFHSALPAIVDAAWQGAELPVVLLNNNAALTTGGQEHPGVANGRGAPLSYEAILSPCGVAQYRCVNLDQDRDTLRAAIAWLMGGTGLRFLQLDITGKA